MSRVEKHKQAKKTRRTLVYPIMVFVLLMIFFMLVVDYRVNDSLGDGQIKIARVEYQTPQALDLIVFGEKLAKLDLTYLRRDFYKIRYKIRAYVKNVEDMVQDVIKRE